MGCCSSSEVDDKAVRRGIDERSRLKTNERKVSQVKDVKRAPMRKDSNSLSQGRTPPAVVSNSITSVGSMPSSRASSISSEKIITNKQTFYTQARVPITLTFPKFMVPEQTTDEKKVVELNGITGVISYRDHAEFAITETADQAANQEQVEELHNKMLNGFKEMKRTLIEEGKQWQIGINHGEPFIGFGFTTFSSWTKEPAYLTCTTHIIFTLQSKQILLISFSSYHDQISDLSGSDRDVAERAKSVASNHHAFMVEIVFQPILDSISISSN
eukprot:TRINITY_DN9658_c0_g1_i1.p1 TRINITY_DN9658_c0_g1~~TRINITY_DN9658_c0_g1_i1.p1  ORF type:complete len:272 (+),score=58.98 TRINITY_DN9658_c0_g1_i1:71-886(+)